MSFFTKLTTALMAKKPPGPNPTATNNKMEESVNNNNVLVSIKKAATAEEVKVQPSVDCARKLPFCHGVSNLGSFPSNPISWCSQNVLGK
ncbi:unnamed protein product [Caenorhabditis auriculariae]|uniref:Uncharacterized protein n=1 Tax=Caenorhabditis auriculariae TaxID=2777116 RepID=A0A8S1HJE7_9PELO|nr:unnamed protein product [Caenorhabditis auriculariae]